jgi:hypothetical protein
MRIIRRRPFSKNSNKYNYWSEKCQIFILSKLSQKKSFIFEFLIRHLFLEQ